MSRLTIGSVGGPYVSALGLRIAVIVVGLAGLYSLPASGLIEPANTTLAALLFVGAACASVQFSSPAGHQARKVLSIVWLISIGLFVGITSAAGLADTGPAGLGPLLAMLLVGLHIAHGLVLNSRRDLLVGMTVGLFMLVLASGLSPGPAVAGPLIVGWPAAVVCLVLAHRLQEQELSPLAAQVRYPRESAGPSERRALMARTALTVAVSVLVGTIVFLLLPQPDGLSARSRLLGSQLPGEVGGGTASRDAALYSGGTMDLNARGALGHDPVIDVPAGLGPLWRSAVLDFYDGASWNDSGGNAGNGDLVGGVAPTDPADRGLPNGATVTADVHAYQAFQGVVSAPGRVTNVTADAVVTSMGGSILMLTQAPVGQTAYTVTAVPPITDARTLDSAKGTDQQDGRWTQLPSELPTRVRDLATSLTATAPTRLAAVRAVETYLRANERYDLASPVAPPGADAVDDFLFTSHTGFCEQFASAETVLLRAAGIPARMATGFGYGTTASDNRVLMRSSDAHAWVEVWYAGAGWSPSDPTAGSALAPASTSVVGQLASWLGFALGSAWSRALLALALVLLGLLGWFFVRLRVRRLRALSVAAAPPGRAAHPLLAAFARLEAALAGAGRPRHPAESLAELSRRLPDPGVSPALSTLERQCYAPSPVPVEDAQRAARALDDAAARVIANPDVAFVTHR